MIKSNDELFIIQFLNFGSERVYPGGDEDEVHLQEDESGVQDWIEASQQSETRRIGRDFQKGAEFKSVVDHRTQTEGWKKSNKRYKKVQFNLKKKDLPTAPALRKKLP